MDRKLLLALSVLTLSACTGNGPGTLEGTWTATKPFPVTVTFRADEMQSMGTTKKVSYENKGDEVVVTYLEGANKGRSFRYTVVDDNTIRSDSGTFHRSQ